MGRRAKIVCTLGPASQAPETIRALVDAGMDVARLNFSHGTHEQHAQVYRRVREASDAAGRGVGVLGDLQGPKIRLGRFETGSAVLRSGAHFTITTESCLGTGERASTTYQALARDVVPGDTLLIDDGLVKLWVLSSDGCDVSCRVVEGGPVSDHKGINLPGVAVSVGALTDKDIDDLRFACELGVDMLALSFVRGPEEADAVRQVIDGTGRRLPVIAKIEKPEAVDKLEEIVEAFDGLMVARGDLGVEMPLEMVPLVQKRAILLSRDRYKPVIVATQMLESMVHHARPTRAEASDVANAVLDGADALMLSAETSIGDHAVAAVATMARIIVTVEEQGAWTLRSRATRRRTRQEAIAEAAAEVGRDVGAEALVAFTQTGVAARRLASQRSPIPLLAFTPRPEVRSQLALTWGVETFIVPIASHTDEMVTEVDRSMLALERGQPGDLVVVVAGSLTGSAGTTNMLRVHELGSGVPAQP